jgi:hypothetical protein
MTGFWLVATLLLLLGYVFFVPVFNPKPRPGTLRRDRLNMLLHRQPQTERVQEEPDRQNREWLEAESARNLPDDLDTSAEPASPDTTRGRIPVITLCLLPVEGWMLPGRSLQTTRQYDRYSVTIATVVGN